MKTPAYVFDLDGTLANLDHRLKYIRPMVGDTFVTDAVHAWKVVKVNKTGKAVSAHLINNPSPPPVVFNWKTMGFKPDWDAFHQHVDGDTPIPAMTRLFVALSGAGYDTVVASGRNDTSRRATLKWLDKNGMVPNRILMRRDGDYRQDSVVKREMLDRIRDDHDILMWFEDRKQVYEMLREEGVLVAAVAKGDF